VPAQLETQKPGAFAKRRFKDRRRAWWRRIWWVFPLTAAFEVAVPVLLGLAFSPEHLAFYWGLGLGIAFALTIALGDSPPHHIERWRQGAEGEKATARAVRRLVRAGWVLVHDIDTGRGNIDHVLAGPPGVFLVESKQLAGSLSVSDGVLSVRWREDPTDGYENRWVAGRARASAAQLHARLRADGVDVDWVQPVVVLWGTFEQGSLRSHGVDWVHGKKLAEGLESRPAKLSPERVDLIAESLPRVLGN
jgi:hypothetical protein